MIFNKWVTWTYLVNADKKVGKLGEIIAPRIIRAHNQSGSMSVDQDTRININP